MSISGVTPSLPQKAPKTVIMSDLERREKDRNQPMTMKMWKHALEKTWTSAPINQKLINSQFESVMPVIIAANGGRTKYLSLSQHLRWC